MVERSSQADPAAAAATRCRIARRSASARASRPPGGRSARVQRRRHDRPVRHPAPQDRRAQCLSCRALRCKRPRLARAQLDATLHTMRPTRQPCRQATASPANEPIALPSPWAAPGACSTSRARSPETHHQAPAAAGHGPGPFDRTADEARLERSGTRFGSQPQRMQRIGSWSAPVQDRLVPVDAELHSSRNQTVGVFTNDLCGGFAYLFLDLRSLRRNC